MTLCSLLRQDYKQDKFLNISIMMFVFTSKRTLCQTKTLREHKFSRLKQIRYFPRECLLFYLSAYFRINFVTIFFTFFVIIQHNPL